MQNAAITWSPQTTNQWPDKLWVYKVIPQEFSEAAVSNLLAIAQFTMKDRTTAPEYLLRVDKAAMFFGILEGTCKHLAICPTLGFIEYHDWKAAAHSNLELVTGVPGQQEATQLGLKYLRLAGVDASQLATKPGSSDLDLHWERGTLAYYNEKTEKEVTLTNYLGVYFLRRVDGLNVAGIGYHGGFFICFGNNSKIADLRVTWRNLKPYQFHDCPSPEQVAKWMRSGRVAFRGDRGGLPATLLKLTIFKSTFAYDGQPGDRPMDLVFPYAIFEATAASASKTNFICFEAPMTLSEANWRVLR